MDEALEALEVLLTRRRSTHQGTYFGFEDVELYPKPKQAQLPLLIGGNTECAIRRAARYGAGWLPTGLTPHQLAGGAARLRAYAADAAASRVLEQMGEFATMVIEAFPHD
jgi:alkanesulfonate monooxygenase SsuD/methylene tetrahydromethanopterin reductase-like flavin-dependent oxidoreductase (luciferase family)